MSLQAVLLVAAALFAVGVFGVLSRQAIVMIMMGIELMLNAVILAAGAFWWFLSPVVDIEVMLLVVIAAMTVDMAVGFAIVTLAHRSLKSAMADASGELRR